MPLDIFYAPAIFSGEGIVSPLSVRTSIHSSHPSLPVRPIRNTNGFCVISFEKNSVLD